MTAACRSGSRLTAHGAAGPGRRPRSVPIVAALAGGAFSVELGRRADARRVHQAAQRRHWPAPRAHAKQMAASSLVNHADCLRAERVLVLWRPHLHAVAGTLTTPNGLGLLGCESPPLERRYRGTWELVRAMGSWLLDQPDLHLT